MPNPKLFSHFKNGLAACALIFLSACSNPFAGHSDNSNVVRNAFHTRTENCNRINFNEDHLSDSQLRAVVSCLNSNHEIEAVDRLLQSFSTEELAPLVDFINSTSDLNPSLFYAAKEMYLRLRNDGRLAEIEKLAEKILRQPKSNTALASALKAWAPVARNLIEIQNLSVSGEALDTLASSKSFQRFVSENHKPELVRKFARSTKAYLAEPSAVSIEGLYKILSENNVDEPFKEIASDSKKLEKLSSFFGWVFSNHRFQVFSETLSSIQNKKMTCFAGKVEIANPLKTELKKLARMTPNESKQYFTHDLKNLALVSRGYCEIPYSFNSLSVFLQQASKQPGYDEIFQLLQPLMQDDRFISFLASDAARNWMNDNAYLADNHFFQDLLTLVAQTQHLSLSNNGSAIAQLLDSSVQVLNAQNLEDLILYLAPLTTSSEKFGYHGAHLMYSVVAEFPTLKTVPTSSAVRSKFSQFTQTLLLKPQFAETLTLAGRLIRDKKLNPIIDQSILVFEKFLNRGVVQLAFGRMIAVKANASSLVNWLLDKLTSPEPIVNTACDALTLDWNFAQFNQNSSQAYFNQIDAISACVNSNQTFRSAKDLVIYLSSIRQYSQLLQTQKSVIDEAFSLDPALIFKTIDSFIKIDVEQSKNIKKTLLAASSLVKSTRSILKKPELRTFVSNQLSTPLLYQTVGEYLKSESFTTPEKPSLNIATLRQINVQVDRERFFENEPFASAVKKLFDRYCPGLNPESSACDIDDDQVAIYRKAPDQLIAAIKSEFMNSAQTWSHPSQFKGWRHTREVPSQVSDVEYHLNPMLHLVRNGPNSLNSVFSALNRIQAHHYDLYRFLKDRALRLTLIPYIYQAPDYPANKSREFHERIRIRIVSDLDRLELLATNADFKAFGLVQNMGMGFIREIGLSWADLPQNEWPKTLQSMKEPQNVRTLKEASAFIHAEMVRFDRGIIQKFGDCDPRGKNAARRWIQRRICSNEMFDLSSRLFNLRFLVTLLDRELLEKDNSSGGLALLRDLFYSIYEQNNISQFDQFGNGVDTLPECRVSPSTNPEANPNCSQDLLTLIPKITRLGLLHQVGMSILRNEQTVSKDLIQVANRVATQKSITENISQFLSTFDGVRVIESVVDFGFKSGSKIGPSIEAILPLANLVPNQNWITASVNLLKQYPELLTDQQEVVTAVLSGDGSTFRHLTQFITIHPEAKAFTWLNEVSLNLTPTLVSEVATSLRDIRMQAPEVASTIVSFQQIPKSETTELAHSASEWADALASPKGFAARQTLSTWVKGQGYEDFCDLFSDATTVEKTYNFLEEVHQNPDSRAFFDSCKAFMHLD
jgi:hypothetical protein